MIKTIKKFQIKYNILPTGQVGPITRAKLNELIKKSIKIKTSNKKFVRNQFAIKMK
jgi:hypothetical protein